MDARRALSIKVGSVRRLAADLRSYETELSSYSALLAAAESAREDASSIRRHREFVQECQATILDISHRLADAAAQLHSFVEHNTQLVGSEEWEKAQQLLKEQRALVEQQAADSNHTAALDHAPAPSASSSSSSSSFSHAVPITSPPPPADRFSVAVYGGSQVKEGDAIWTYAEQLGQALAEHDFHIVSGGYGGVMEAVSAGGRRVSGASVEGVLSPAAFPMQGAQGNVYLTHTTLTNDLPHRVIAFLARCQAFVVLPGGLGTLTELCLTWNVSAITELQPQHLQRPLLILAQRQPWEAVVQQLRQMLPISDAFLQHLAYVDDVQQTIERLKQERERFRSDIQRGSAAAAEGKEES